MTDVDARVIGPGRAGSALCRALRDVGWTVEGPFGRDADVATIATGTRFVVLAVPDGVVRSVAHALGPGDAVVVHLAGSLGLDVLEGHARVAAVHPVVALPDEERGAKRLRGAWFGVGGDPAALAIVEALEGRSFAVADRDRAGYHAAATMAANHLVALLGQVQRVAGTIDVPLDAMLDLARGALDDVAAVGPRAALTGPVARGDWDTVARHVAALAEDERPAYTVMADAARRLLTEPHAIGATAWSA